MDSAGVGSKWSILEFWFYGNMKDFGDTHVLRLKYELNSCFMQLSF